MKKNELKYCNIIPLIGGMTIANKLATNKDPEFIVSWEPFQKNDSHIVNHLKTVPYHVIDAKLKENQKSVTDDLKQHKGKIDFVSSVCPCAGLSMLNNSNSATSAHARGSNAVQNDWMYKSSEWVLENLEPKVLWGENAPGLYTSLGKGVRDRLREIGARYGYSFSIVKTDTYLHGIPQHRKRTFYFFWKSKNAPILEWFERDNTSKDLIEYLNEVPSGAKYQESYFTKNAHKPVTDWKLYEFVLEKTGMTDLEFRKSYIGALYHYVSGKGWVDEAITWFDKHYPDYEGEERKKLEHIRKKLELGLGFWDSSPFFVHTYTNAIIGKNMTSIVHPTEDRFLNMRECMHLMGLPHDFDFAPGNEIFNHIAQNVPVKTATSYTEQVVKFINGELRDSGHQFIMQNNMSQKITFAEKGLKKKKNYKTNSII